jgi:peroxiredoxin
MTGITLRAVAVIMFQLLASLLASAQKEIRLVDLDGRSFDPLAWNNAKAVVFIFVRTDCPVSNRYAPEVQRLIREFQPQGIDFFLVYPDPASTVEQIRRHVKDYDYQATVLRDPEHLLVSRTGVTVTPEAVVLSAGKMVYRGRIDDRYLAFATVRPAPTVYDLADTLLALLKGPKPEFRTTTPVGCYISDLRRDPKK